MMLEAYLPPPLPADIVIFTFRVQQFHFFITAGQLVIWGVALLVAVVTRRLVGRRMALGSIGILLAALVGVWIATSVIIIGLPSDLVVYDVPLLKALVGAVVLEMAWFLLTYSSYRVWAGRRRYNDASRAKRRGAS